MEAREWKEDAGLRRAAEKVVKSASAGAEMFTEGEGSKVVEVKSRMGIKTEEWKKWWLGWWWWWGMGWGGVGGESD